MRRVTVGRRILLFQRKGNKIEFINGKLFVIGKIYKYCTQQIDSGYMPSTEMYSMRRRSSSIRGKSRWSSSSKEMSSAKRS